MISEINLFIPKMIYRIESNINSKRLNKIIDKFTKAIEKFSDLLLKEVGK